MKLVNKSGVPESIFRFLSKSDSFYDKDAAAGTISVTTLLRPIQEIVLMERHADKIEVDAMDCMWALLGSGVHAVLEKVEGYEPCGRLYASIGGYKISGKPDFIDRGRICDYKVTSAWTLVFKDRFKEWVEQLSIYRWLYAKDKRTGLEDTGEIVAILRDWSEKNIKQGGSYPDRQMVSLEFPLMSLKETEEFVEQRLDALKAARQLPDEFLPACTEEERWFDPKRNIYKKCEKYCKAKEVCYQVKDCGGLFDGISADGAKV